MPTTKRHGKTDVVLWRKDGGSLVDLSGSSRTVDYTQEGSKTDASTRDDMVANATSSFTNPPERALHLAGLDTTPSSSRTWANLEIGDSGQLAHYPLGTGSGNPYKIGSSNVRTSTYASPHDGPATWDINWDYVGAVNSGTTP